MYPDSMPAGTNPPPAPEHLSSAAFAKLGLPFSEMVRLGDTLIEDHFPDKRSEIDERQCSTAKEFFPFATFQFTIRTIREVG